MYQRLRITAITTVRPDFKTFALEPDPTQPLIYQAGQYLTLLSPQLPQTVRRSYSLVSVPELHEPLTIGVKRIPNGVFSRYLIDSARVGDELLCAGTGGFFTLPENIAAFRQVFLLAAGSGITPVLALIKSLLAFHPEIKVVLIYSSASADTALFKNQLDALQEQYAQTFTVEYIFSDAPNLARAHLYRELLVELLKEYAVTNPENLLAYTCGPENYMRMCTYGFRFAGIPLAQIRKEIFDINKALPKVLPPDTNPHEVTFKTRRETYNFTSQYPHSILESARQTNLTLPYSCNAGRCGNCVATCTQGQVWMANNEVLTERDLNRGLVLPCVAYPVGGPVTLEI